jgi:UMF1 family MFS transporter
LLAQFTPIGRQGEFFGLFSVTGKFAAIIGPILYGEVTAWTGSQRWAVLSMGLFFLIGLIVLQWVDERRGITAAQEERR